eukprot:jgi/Undpi1/12466/HiC_scaffold_5.g02137.m1
MVAGIMMILVIMVVVTMIASVLLVTVVVVMMVMLFMNVEMMMVVMMTTMMMLMLLMLMMMMKAMMMMMMMMIVKLMVMMVMMVSTLMMLLAIDIHMMTTAMRMDILAHYATNVTQVVSGKYKGNDKFFTLATHGGKYFAVSEACGRCKFPMINGRVKVLLGEGKAEDVKEGVEDDPEADVGIGCPLCGAIFDMRTGAIAGEQPKGLAQTFVSKIVSQSNVESITPYQAQELSTGAIVVRVD